MYSLILANKTFTFCVAAFVVAFLWQPQVAMGQVIEEDNSEVIVSGQTDPKTSETPDLSEVARSMVVKTNEFRAHQGLPSVARSEHLDAAAQYFAGFMARTSKYGHRADGQSAVERAREHGYSPCITAENIDWQFSNQPYSASELAGEFMADWKASAKHRKNMLDPDVTEIGLAVAYNDETLHFYAVQILARPKSHAIEIRIANRTATEIGYQMGNETSWLPAGFVRTHERCRPTEVVFHLPSDDPSARKRSFAIHRKASFTISRDPFGGIDIRREFPVNERSTEN